MFGRSQAENCTTPTTGKTVCKNCLRLQGQVGELTTLLAQKEEEINELLGGSDNEVLGRIQKELLEFGEKYNALRKKLKQIEKDNSELVIENGILEKQVAAYRSHRQKGEPADFSRSGPDSFCAIEERSQAEEDGKQMKELEVALFVEREKVAKLEVMVKDQGDEIVRLKELLSKRNQIQEQRH